MQWDTNKSWALVMLRDVATVYFPPCEDGQPPRHSQARQRTHSSTSHQQTRIPQGGRKRHSLTFPSLLLALCLTQKALIPSIPDGLPWPIFIPALSRKGLSSRLAPWAMTDTFWGELAMMRASQHQHPFGGCFPCQCDLHRPLQGLLLSSSRSGGGHEGLQI